MSKNKKSRAAGKAANPSERMGRAVRATATDNQNLNTNHNAKKEALGPNTDQ